MVWHGALKMWYLTCIFVEPLKASFTRKCLLLTDLCCFVFSENAADDEKVRVKSTAAIQPAQYRGSQCDYRKKYFPVIFFPIALTKKLSVLLHIWDRHRLFSMLVRWSSKQKHLKILNEIVVPPVLTTFLCWHVISSRGSPLFPRRHGSGATSWRKEVEDRMIISKTYCRQFINFSWLTCKDTKSAGNPIRKDTKLWQWFNSWPSVLKLTTKHNEDRLCYYLRGGYPVQRLPSGSVKIDPE